MSEINIILVSLLFFFIGYFSSSKKTVKENTDFLKKKVMDGVAYIEKKKYKKIKAGVIPFKSEEDFEDEISGDKALEKEWRKNGIAKLLKRK